MGILSAFGKVADFKARSNILLIMPDGHGVILRHAGILKSTRRTWI
ncbi:MAG: hypothetical protein M2R45_03722 [Verrucomicrobia subdivision 3 bacterium]|nr:hypothetical protein [Limisphaerales bacterium]MCS1416954.1 hypothetical protein [Limisphaerales bacterium]